MFLKIRFEVEGQIFQSFLQLLKVMAYNVCVPDKVLWAACKM